MFIFNVIVVITGTLPCNLIFYLIFWTWAISLTSTPDLISSLIYIGQFGTRTIWHCGQVGTEKMAQKKTPKKQPKNTHNL